MYIKVVCGGGLPAIVNPNCNIRLIYEYIRLKVNAPDNVEVDVCDHHGELMNIHEKPFHTSGLEIFERRGIYYAVTFTRSFDGKLRKPSLAAGKEVSKETEHLFIKLKKALIRQDNKHESLEEGGNMKKGSSKYSIKKKHRLSTVSRKSLSPQKNVE